MQSVGLLSVVNKQCNSEGTSRTLMSKTRRDLEGVSRIKGTNFCT